MPDLFDFAQALMGRPDPRQQLYAALGQGPGQPGSSQGPQPLAGQNAPPGGPAGPGGPPGASGGPSAAQAPPTPQAYQSPPDLATAYQALAGGGPSTGSGQPPPDMAQMFMAMQQREQAKQGFWGGLAGVAKALHPGRVNSDMMSAIRGPQDDTGSLFNNIVQLQQYQQQNQAMQAYRQALPGMLDKAGLDQSLAPVFAANPSLFGDVLKSQMGLTGTQTDKEYKQQVLQFQKANPGQPLPPDLQSEGAWDQQQREAITTRDTAAKTKTADLIADQHNFAPALGNYDKGIGLIDQFMTPKMQAGAQEFLGTGGSLRPVASMSADGKAAWALYKQIMATQFSAGVQDFKGAGRITQQELTQDAPSQSTMGQLNQDPNDFFAGVQKYRDQLAQKRAGLFDVAQKGDDPRLSDEDYAKYVLPNQDLTGGPKRNIPDFSKMRTTEADAAYDALPSGKVFIDTDGQAKKKP